MNDSKEVQQFDDGIRWIEFKPAKCKVLTVRKLMVVVLIQLSQKHQVPNQCILGPIAVIKINITILVTAPIYYCPLNRAHHEVNGEENEKP